MPICFPLRGKFTCPSCPESFITFKDLEEHIKSEHSDELLSRAEEGNPEFEIHR